MTSPAASAASLKGKVAVVTGGGRGIGAAIVERLARDGATVIVNYAKNAQAAEDLCSRLKTDGCELEPMQFDVADEAAVTAAFEAIIAKHSRIDILVNNAGIAIDSLFVRTSAETWDKILGTNLNGCFYCSRAAVKFMMKQRAGRIVNISSVVGEMGNPGQVAYSTSKAALFGFTKSLAKELGGRGINVNAVTPGFIETDMTAVMTADQVEKYQENIALRRLGKSEEVAGVVAFLVGSDSAYVTGHVLSVNGGLYM